MTFSVYRKSLRRYLILTLKACSYAWLFVLDKNKTQAQMLRYLRCGNARQRFEYYSINGFSPYKRTSPGRSYYHPEERANP
jgi:hypothetical protein